MRDMGNLGDGGEPFELWVSSLSELIPYVQGVLRGDMTGPEGRDVCDEAVDALRREQFPLAEKLLRACGVYLSIEWVEGDES